LTAVWEEVYMPTKDAIIDLSPAVWLAKTDLTHSGSSPKRS